MVIICDVFLKCEYAGPGSLWVSPGSNTGTEGDTQEKMGLKNCMTIRFFRGYCLDKKTGLTSHYGILMLSKPMAY